MILLYNQLIGGNVIISMSSPITIRRTVCRVWILRRQCCYDQRTYHPPSPLNTGPVASYWRPKRERWPSTWPAAGTTKVTLRTRTVAVKNTTCSLNMWNTENINERRKIPFFLALVQTATCQVSCDFITSSSSASSSLTWEWDLLLIGRKIVAAIIRKFPVWKRKSGDHWFEWFPIYYV